MNNQRLAKIIDVVSFVFVVLSILFIPIILDRSLVSLYIIPKQYVLGAVTLIILLLWSTKMVITRKLVYRKSILDWPLVWLLGLGLVTSIFSVSVYDSFWGRGEYFVLNFVFLLFSILYYFLLVNHIDTRARWQLVLNSLVLIGGVTVLLFIIRSAFNPAWLTALVGANIWNTIDYANSVFGLWIVAIFILSAGRLIKKDLSAGSSVFNFLVAIISLTGIALLGFGFLWWVTLIGLVFLLFLGVSFVNEARMWWLSALFATLVLTTIFIIFGPPKFLQSAVPTEISLGAKPSWDLSSSVALSGVKNFLVGTGLGTFNYDFSRFRSVNFNSDQIAWSLRFNQPINSFLSFLAEGGVLFTLTLAFLFLFVIGHVFFVWYKMRLDGMLRSLTMDLAWQKNDIRLDIFLVVIAWAILSIGFFVSFYGPVMWWLWWLLLAMSITGISFINPMIIKTKELEIEDAPQYSLSFSFLMIVVMAAVIMVAVWGVRLYSAEKSYAEAGRSTDVKAAENKLLEAISRRDNVDVYHALLAQVYLMEAGNLSKAAKPDMQAVSGLVAQAVNEAKRSTDISPNSVMIWENLATMYENAAMLVPEARDWAIKSLLKAKELEPTNPVLAWRLGNNYSLLSKWDDASKNYQEAINLKSDYVGAYVSLAAVYEQNKQLDKAVDLYKTILPRVSNQVELLYNFGRLLYNRNGANDRADAEKLWLRAIEIEPNHSNTLYSLGLLYEIRGNRAAALQYYYKVKDLNPGNKDIITKIQSLVGGSLDDNNKK